MPKVIKCSVIVSMWRYLLSQGRVFERMDMGKECSLDCIPFALPCATSFASLTQGIRIIQGGGKN